MEIHKLDAFLCVLEKFKVNMPERKSLNFQSPPSFIAPLKWRLPPQGYECCMSCAVKGDPAPCVTWYHNNISLHGNTNYHIINTCGVCSLLILKVRPKDRGEYKVIINNKLGTAESSTTINVRGIVLFLRFLIQCKKTLSDTRDVTIELTEQCDSRC